MFNASLAIKKANVPGLSQVRLNDIFYDSLTDGFAPQIVDAVVFKVLRAATGGRLRLAMSGAYRGVYGWWRNSCDSFMDNHALQPHSDDKIY